MAEVVRGNTAEWPGSAIPLFVFVLGMVLLVLGTWSESGLTDPDEFLRTLRTPIEMMERNSWLTPWLDGRPRLQKPPLIY